jgi:uncharacterized protein (TIGR02598 family)
MTMPKQQATGGASRGGFSLVEVTLALGLAAFAMVAIFGLLPTGLRSNQTSTEQMAAAGMASGIVADLQAAPVSIPPQDTISPRFQISLKAPNGSGTAQRTTFFLGEDGAPAGAVNADANSTLKPRYRATVYVTPAAASGDTYQRTATTVRILITWPALADPSAAADPQKFAGSFEAITMLDRN